MPPGVVAEAWEVRGSQRAIMRTQADAADLVVLVPGFTGSKEDFIAVLPLLAERGFDGLSFDQLGQFESDGSDDPADYALDLLAADLATIIDGARRRHPRVRRVWLVGHSFGGLVAQRAIADGLNVDGFVALCTGPGALPAHRHGGLADLIDALPHSDMAAIWAVMREQARAAGERPVAPEIRDFLERRWLGNNPHQIREFAHALMTAPPVNEHVRAAVDGGLRVVVMWGENDDAWPIDEQRAMAATWGAPTVSLEGLGHSPNADGPAQLVEALTAFALLRG